MMTDNTSAASPRALTPRVKIWLELDGQYVFGRGLCRMLSAVEETGSIKAAAVEVGKSYRYVWGRIKDAEETLGISLVTAHVGGAGVRRSELTPRARELLTDYLALRERMLEVMTTEFAERFRNLKLPDRDIADRDL